MSDTAPSDTAPANEAFAPAEDDHIATRHSGKRWNILSVLSLIAALVASPLAMPFGYIALRQISRSDQSGRTLAWIAVGLGWLWLSAYIVIGVAAYVIWAENPFWL